MSPVAGSHDGGVPGVEVLHIIGQCRDVLLAGDDHSTWNRRSYELVTADADAANGLAESHHGSSLHEWDLHRKCFYPRPLLGTQLGSWSHLW